MKIKEMKIEEQPRCRLMQYGVENLSNVDLLSIILRTGTKDINVKEVSNNILNSVDSINNLSNIGIRELSNIKGVGNVKALTILASIEFGKRVSNKEINLLMKLDTPFKIHEAFKKDFKNLHQEKLMGIYLDNKKRLISYKILSIGTINKTIISPRDIYKEALKVNASSIVLIHNHPSLDLTPSNEDILVTNNIREAGKFLDIPVVDHLITNGEEYVSFYEIYYKR